MTILKQAEYSTTFEQVLLDYVDMCYSVALAMTRNPHDARRLTREVMTWAWQLRDNADTGIGIKIKLLLAMRKRFLLHYRHPTCRLADRTALAERM